MICDGMRGCESRREQFLRDEILIVRVWNLYGLFWNGCVKVGNEI